MTNDAELIARLRDLGFNLTDAAADRIEALTEQLTAAQHDAKEAEAYAEEVEADRKKTYEALLKVSRIHGEVEAKLAKAVELALEECPFRHGTPKYNDWWHHRRTALAEIKGESHD